MADTWRENAIVQAIQIIADKKIAQAGYDKTIKGVINKVLDKTKGKYQIKYQDSLFEAFSTSAKVQYVKDQQVSVLIPGNDWDRIKTILGGVDIKATNYQQVPIVSQGYNKIGTSGTSLKKNIELSSYVGDTGTVIDLVNQGYITLNNTNNFINYVKKGNGIALGMKVRTALADGQIGGDYGLRFYLKFNDNVNKTEVIKPFEVNIKDVIGHPYLLTSDTIVETLIKDIDIQNFKGIDSIQAYCIGFPENIDKINIKDIFISDVFINGASVLSDQDLNGYVLHIDYSEKGNIIEKNSTASIPFAAQLKVDGKITTQDVKYYWFRQNATVFKGDKGKYSGYAGDGWECLNYYTGDSFVAKTDNIFYFKNGQPNSNAEKIDIQKNNTAYAPQKVTKILCVAVYDNKNWITGQAQVINNNASNITIVTKQVIETYDQDDKKWVTGNLDNPVKTIYYLDNGTPTLICNTDLTGSGISYSWSVKPARGSAISKIANSTDNNNYNTYKSAYKFQIDKANGMAKSSKDSYIKTTTYINAINNWNNIKNKERINANVYYNFPIKSISEYSTVSCAVTQNGVYKGTASIVLYNKTELEGMYSLNLENGTQVFQYDGKGNSPASPQREKPIQIIPLTFTLIDNEGKEISHEQIKNNGSIKWIIPNTQTLLKSNGNGDPDSGGGATDLTVTRATLPLLAKYYDVYSNKDSFNYTIENQYDTKKDINYIWLHVKYKDMQFDAYTNFTFPKDGDPGTNGTDYVAKLVPNTGSDRVYISDKAPFVIFDDNGADVTNLKFQLYNNSVITNLSANYWTCPPVTTSTAGADTKSSRGSSYLTQNGNWSKPKLSVSGKTLANIQIDKPVNIIRAQHGTGQDQNDLKYFAECPICTEFVTNANYRLKIKPKTGFQYVVYSEDGTRPDYDNNLPFEIIVQHFDGTYWNIDSTNRTCDWYAIGNITPSSISNSKTATFKPKDIFDGSDLSSAIVCEVSGIGRIHVPIYMILNRYGHSALNGWDGNSIQLNANGDTILAPQIGAGKKQSEDNTFTGILMGDVKTANSIDTGIMGYDHGARSIFMDAKTGNAIFGKQGAAQIKITASSGQGTIQSGDYSYNTSNHNGKGLKIKFSSTGSGSEQGPYIRYGSNKFSVSADGSIHAAGSGDIAGWNITDTKLHKDNKVGMASSDETVPTDIGLKNGNDDTVAFWAGGTLNTSGTNNGKLKSANFYVTHGGYLYSKLGRIAKWNINENTLQHTDGKVGMGTGSNKTFHYTDSSNNSTSISITNPRFWAINGNKQCIIDNNGKLWANEARIGPWLVDQSKLSNGYTGLGSNLISSTDMNNAFGSGTTSNGIQARIWASTANTNKSVNFVVSNDGKLYSKAGKIGGWNIEEDKLWAGSSTQGTAGIQINANGSLTGGQQTTGNNAHNYTWAISKDGAATFNNLNANNTGTIAGWKINSTQLSSPDNTMVIQKKGAISGPSWSIDQYGNASFSYIRGSIASTGGSNVSLTGGGGYGSGGYTLRSDGYLGVGSSGQGMVFSGGNLTVTGTIQAKAGYIGSGSSVWSIDENGIVNGSNHVYPTGIVIGNSEMNGEVIQAHTRFDVAGGGSGNQGQTGHIKFSDGADIYVKGGIIVSVSPGEDVIWG